MAMKEAVSTFLKSLTKIGQQLQMLAKYRAIMSYFAKLLEPPKSKLARMNRIEKCATYGGGLFVFGLFFGLLIFPEILKFAIHQNVSLKPGTQARSLWSNVPFPIHFRVYLFNVTNPNEIKNGEKPILRQVGPYYFEEWHKKEIWADDNKEDTIEYSMKDTYLFKQEMSNGLTGEEELMLPHIFILTAVMAVLREKPSAMPAVNKAMNNIFKNPENVFIQAKAMDFMFRGLPIDCSVTDGASTAVCNIIRENKDAFIVDDENHFRFSLFGSINDTVRKGRYKSFRGKKKQADIGQVVEFNGKKNMSKWNDTVCDTINGTDGYIFHPYFYKDEDMVIFAPPLCRSLFLYFEKESESLGFNTNRYTMWFGDPNTMPEQKCYCPDSGCLKSGVMDLHKCLELPLVISLPHFFRADEAYLHMVDGLDPNYDQHAIYADMVPFAGAPVTAVKRIQINIMIFKVEKFKIMKNFPEALLPLFWVEDSFILPKDLAFLVKLLLIFRTTVKAMSIMMILVGISLLGFAAFLFYQEKQEENQIQEVLSNNENSGGTNVKNNNNTKSVKFTINSGNPMSGRIPFYQEKQEENQIQDLLSNNDNSGRRNVKNNGNTKTVRFAVNSISNPIPGQIPFID